MNDTVLKTGIYSSYQQIKGGTMKEKFFLIVTVIVLILASLACGSSNSGVSVNPPNDNAAEVEEQPAAESEATEAKPVGSARSNPAPMGSEVVADDRAFKVLSIIRPADDIVIEGNPFNTKPESGQEYLFVELQITCQKSIDEKCSLSSFWNFSVIGSSGVSKDAEWVLAGVEGLLESIDFYGDTTVSGYLPFIVRQDEIDLVFVYEPLLFGDTFYLALPNQ